MAHFAEVTRDGFVVRVTPLDNALLIKDGVECEEVGREYLRNLFGGTWIQTSYNKTFRKNFASRGMTYSKELDAFITPKPFRSWVLNEDTCQWQAPTPMPEDDNIYLWILYYQHR